VAATRFRCASRRNSMVSLMSKLMMIVASTRPGRVGLPVSKWFGTCVEQHGAFELEVVDLLELNLPFMDEPKHPRFADYQHQHTKDWSSRVDAADAFAIVMPEYNYGFNAPIKNAIDFLYREWHYKPAGLVSYGGIAAGTRAAQMLKQVLTTVKLTVPSEAVAIPFVAKLLNDDGTIEPNDSMQRSAFALLDELVRLDRVLLTLRNGDAS